MNIYKTRERQNNKIMHGMQLFQNRKVTHRLASDDSSFSATTVVVVALRAVRSHEQIAGARSPWDRKPR